ncbi:MULTISPECIES: hypothetical protein [Heyndrickxia]|uniref:hypothetical protein n=1 Tax=Heyndrickxia TaxID=2837504 RepID=UPI000A7DF695|nr:hypothetical protein [Heyndrickxia shackletonii]NEY99890.1 hypothetical protein [Heyndrickxia shackletonii]
MTKETFDFETISRALKQTYDVIQSEEKPSEKAIQNILEAKETLNEAIMYKLEKDCPAI